MKKLTFKSLIVILCSLSILISGCNSEEILPDEIPRTGQEFFAFENNKQVIYEVYDIKYTNSGSDTSHYFQKEVLSNQITTSTEKKYYYSVYQSNKLDSNYTIKSTFVYSIKNQHVLKTVDNLVYQTSVLPLSKTTTFDQNLFNDLPKKTTLVNALYEDKTFTDFLSTRTFTNSLDLELERSINNIENIYKHQVYELDKGLTYELNQEIDQQPGQFPIGYKILKIRVL